MAQVLLTEAPGGLGEVYQCPNCSRTYLAYEVTEAGELTNQPKEPPRTCIRCGSPMDVEKALAFSDEMAEKAAAAPGRATRRFKTI